MARRAFDYYSTPEWCYKELPIQWELFESALKPYFMKLIDRSIDYYLDDEDGRRKS